MVNLRLAAFRVTITRLTSMIWGRDDFGELNLTDFDLMRSKEQGLIWVMKGKSSAGAIADYGVCDRRFEWYFDHGRRLRPVVSSGRALRTGSDYEC